VSKLKRPKSLWAAIGDNPGNERHGFKARAFAGVMFLACQLVMIVYARFVPWRYFCWAPNDYNVEYTLQVTAKGSTLTPQEVGQRYHLTEGVYHSPVQHIIDIVQQYEETYGRNDHARVVLVYHVNGREAREWSWPTR
jgi:hypothetical protein